MSDQKQNQRQFLHDQERTAIGYILSNGTRAYLTASRYVDEGDFDLLPHRIIFGCIGAVISHGEDVSVVSLHEFIRKNPELLSSHFKRYSFKGDINAARANIIDLIIEISTLEINPAFNLQSVVKSIREHSMSRQLIEMYEKKIQKLREGVDPFDALDDTYQTAVSLYSRFEDVRPFHTIKDASDELIDLLERERRGEVVRLSTGFKELDGIIKGYENGRLYVIGAEEKIGKSILVSQSALNLAIKNIPVGMLSLEMKRTELARRYLSMLAGSDAIKNLDTKKLRQIAQPLELKPLYLYDLSLNTKQLAGKVQSLVMEKKARLIIVDYLQLVEPSTKAWSKTDEINQTVRTLKRLAMDLNIPIVLIASLTIKGIHSRSEKKPKASDFRDSGQIPYDADAIIFLWKPDENDDSYREMFVDRSRYSPIGEPIGLMFNAERLKFSVIARRQVPKNGELQDGPKYF